MITGKEIKVLDQNSAFFGIPTMQLMENAGRGIAEFVSSQLHPKGKNILVLCGPGNNGGDGFVAARYLAKKFNVSLFLTCSEQNIKTDIAQMNYKKLKKHKVALYTGEKLGSIDALFENSEIIIDSLLGIGLSGTLKDPYKTIVKKVLSLKHKTIVSVDVPTGLGTNLAVSPGYTVTFHASKEGMTKENSGAIHIVDIGFPPDAVEYVGPGELVVYYPRHNPQSHKGDNGTVLVVGGGPYVGAPALAGLAALRTGADLVFVATPKRSWEVVASFSPDLIVQDLTSDHIITEDVPIVKQLLPRCNTLVIGPGLGTASETQQAIQEIIQFSVAKKKTLVIDADAIPAVANNLDIIRHAQTVITPHAGEFKDLTGVRLPTTSVDRLPIVKKWAARLDVTILLKGYEDIITNGHEIKRNKIHNEAMTVGGTGDVLSGIIGALLAKSVNLYTAARIGAFLNGAAGNEAFGRYAYGMLATDILEAIPLILKKYL